MTEVTIFVSTEDIEMKCVKRGAVSKVFDMAPFQIHGSIETDWFM